MARVEDSEHFGGTEDWGPYIGPGNVPYHGKYDHIARSIAHSPNHLRFVGKMAGTDGGTKDFRRLMRRLMRRIRRP